MRRRFTLDCARTVGFVLLITGAACAQTEQDVAERNRLDLSRFEHQTEFGDFQLGVSYTGRTVIAGKRSIVVRKHLVVEVLFVPPNSDGIRLSHSAFLLRVNGEKQPRLPQSPEVVAYAVRNADLSLDPRLTATAGVGSGGVVWDSRTPRRDPRFPGDPRTPRRPPLQRAEDPYPADPMAAEAETILGQAFPSRVITEPVAGYLYFPGDMDLDKIKKLELIFAPDESGGKQTSVRLR